MTTSVAFSHGPILHWDGTNSQLTATIRNNPVAGHLSPILACSLDVMKESGAPEDEFTEFLAEIVKVCDTEPGAVVSVESPDDPALEPSLVDPQYSTSYLASGPTPKWVQKLDSPDEPITHLCPGDGQATYPCCGKFPLEGLGGRMTLIPELVTCPGKVTREQMINTELKYLNSPQGAALKELPALDLAKLVSEQVDAIVADHQTSAADVRADAAFERGWTKGYQVATAVAEQTPCPVCKTREQGLRPPAAWELETGIFIADPDGWREDGQPWETPISRADFCQRAGRSTTTVKRG